MRFWKKRLQRVAAMVCSVALVASMMPTAAFATESEPTPTPEPTPVVETAPTPEPSESPESTDAAGTTPAPGTGTGSTSAPVETPTETPDGTKEPVESPEPSGEPTDDTTESGEENVENTESPDESEKQPASTPVMLSAEAATANTPQARAVGYIYEDSEKGISITFNAQGSRTHHFVITENGTLLWEGDVSGFQAGANSVTIIAPGYEVSTSVDWEGILAQGTFTHDDTGDNYTLLPYYDNVTARIELSSFKTFDDVQIVDSDDGTNYGTFSWLKGDADNDDFPRTLTIVVDGETVHSQTVYTPNRLENVLGQPDQYWFTPSSGFKYEYEMSPSDWMDSITREDLTINLTSECPCGNDLCTCPGGAECNCEQGCGCDYCKPTDEDRTIRTTYGTISYKEPSAEGYNLTVETYVNGTLVDTQKNLRIRASENDSLAYTPASGYYYYNDQNSYDIITLNDDSWWDQRTGHILIVGTDEASRNYDNVLKVYLWTFNNHLTLDVNRSVGGPLDHVTGYTISFEAPDPSNPNTTKTYTYEATSFAGAQQQMIPFATWVTITPICETGYEVAQWSTASQYSGVSLRGSEGNEGSKAYGNSAGLFVDGTARDSLLLYIDSVRTVEPPTGDELIKNEPDDNPDAPYFDGNVAVVVDCVNADAKHEDSTYGLIQGTFEVSKLKGRSDTGYYVEVTIKDPQAYVDCYNLNVEGHTRSDSEDVVITLRWVVENHESVWKADGPATIKVTCEDEPEPGIDPTEPDPSILTDAVNVICSTDKTHPTMQYGILRHDTDDYKVDWTEGAETATITIKDSDPYVDKYNEDNPPQDNDNPHVFDEDWKNNDLTISLKWVDNAWTVEDPADIYVCDKYKDGTPIKVSVYLDGEDVTANWKNYLTLGGNTDKTKNFVYTYNESTNTIECKYVYQTYNSADMVIEAKDAYKLQALDADLMYGSAGSDGYDTTTGVLDNVAGGSEVKIYLATEYSVEYYVDGKASGTYTDEKIYTVLDDAVPEEDLTKIPNEELVDEEKDDLNPENGMQKVYAVVWVADDLEDTITLADTTGLNAWYPKWDETSGTVDGDKLNASLELAAILADTEGAIYTVNGNVIKFFGETANESVDLTKSIVSVKRGDVTLTGKDIPATFKVGDVVTYQVEVANTGNVALSGLTITDTLTAQGAEPENLAGDSGDFAWEKGTDNWIGTVGNVELAANETKTYKYTYTVVDADKGNTITNAATVKGDGDDPTGEGETETEVENPDVTVTKSLTAITRNGESVKVDKNTTLKVGDEITYEINVENTGNVDLTGLTVTDTFNGNGTLPEVKDADGYVVGLWNETSGVWTYVIANLPVKDEETFTYTYTVVQLDAAETDGLTNTAAVSGDGTDPDDEDKDERPVKDDGTVTMEIADITTYMGGIAGYDGAVEGGNATQSNSLPKPGFYFTLQDDINSELSTALGHESTEAVDLSQYITLTATDKDGITHTWSLKKYGNEHSASMEDGRERYVYKIDNQNGAPIRVEFKNDAGDIVTNDNFSVDDALAENYTMSIYLGDVEVDSISFAIRIPKSRDDNTTVKTYYCGFEGGKTNAILTVRHTTGEARITLAEENLETALESPDKQDDFLVEVTQEHDININEAGGAAGVDVTNSDVYLLADGIEELESEASLVQTAQEQANFESSRTEAKYLDLVDANNGNAWLTSEQQVTVYWPYPEGTDRNTNFKLFHYEGMDRDTTGTVAPKEVTIVEKTETGITFNTSSFSPFVLVWDTTQPSGGEDKLSGGGDGNNDNNNNNTNTNNQTTTVNVANQAAAPAAAPAAVSVPQTSDDMPIGALTAAAVAAAAALVGLLVVRKRRQK